MEGISNSGYVNLDYIVKSVIMERNDDDRWYEKYLQLAINGYLELNITDNYKNIKTTTITVNNQNTAIFPNDYINYVSIAFVHQGRLVPLTRNDNIAIPVLEDCGLWDRETTTTSTNGEFDNPNSYLDRNYSNVARYTQGGGFNGAYYRIDEANKQIVFLQHKTVGMTLLLEYKSVGLSNETIIPRDAVMALKAFVSWEIEDNSNITSESAIERRRRKWLRERGKLYARQHAFTKSEWLDKRYEHTHRGLK